MNSERGLTDPEQILKLKDELLERFGQLPAEHQATMALVVIEVVMAGELGEWLREAIALRWPRQTDIGEGLFPVTAVSRDGLKEMHFSDEEIAQLTEEDMNRIARMMQDHYVNDLFWDDFEFMAGEVLERRRRESR